MSKCKHRNIWLIFGGDLCWCYECGAIRPNVAGSRKQRVYWQPPSYSKENPAMKNWYPALTWRRS